MTKKFYQMTWQERLELLNLPEEVLSELKNTALSSEIADNLIENRISEFELPMGLCFLALDAKSYLVPMVTEEPSVIAAANNGAKIAGNFTVKENERLMNGQIIFYDVKDSKALEKKLIAEQAQFFKIAETAYPSIYKRGGGLRKIDIARVQKEGFLSLDFYFDTRDAMGANMINTMLEAISNYLRELLPDEKILFSILSNEVTFTYTRVECRIPLEKIGQETAEKIVVANRYAQLDQARAATHNKGIMNGIEAVVLATGNDTRAVNSAFYSRLDGGVATNWEIIDNDLVGELGAPIPIATAGGASHVLPKAKIAHDILGNPNALELAAIIAAVGLANNLAALKALVGPGIQKGHMALQARSLAISAGAKADEIEEVAKLLKKADKMNLGEAQHILSELCN